MGEFSEKLSALTEKIMKDKKALFIVALAIAGMLLILFSDDSKDIKE